MAKTVIFVLIFLILFSTRVFAINPYCTTPPFVQANLPSNIMLVLDYSGSMGWDAYADPYVEGAVYYKTAQVGDWQYVTSYYNPRKTYYGYFIPDKNYSVDRSGIWHIDPNGEYSGNFLNWYYMKRIDILRWILTGGEVYSVCRSVKGCDVYEDSTSCISNPLCVWKTFYYWSWCENEYYCSSLNRDECQKNELCSLGESYVVTYDGVKIREKDTSTYNPDTKTVEGILQRIAKQKQKPRIGAVIYSDSVEKRVKLSYEYTNLINTINNTTIYTSTCTSCAMSEMLDFFSNKDSTVKLYGNKSPYEWGVNNKSVPCAKNFILLMSDGEWNTGGDPVSYVDKMWKGGSADLVKKLDGKQNVRVYTVAMFLSSFYGKNALKWMAVYGNYSDLDGNGYPCNQTKYPDNSLTETENLSCNEVKPNKDKNGPYGFFEGDNPKELKEAIAEAFNEILKQVSSGTAVSVLSEKKRANMGVLQAAFYPEKTFVSGNLSYTVKWIGSLFNWWFYNTYSDGEYVNSIREDTINNKHLDVCSNGKPGGDYIIEYVFEDNRLKLKGYKSACDGKKASKRPSVVYSSLDSANYVWEAGMSLLKEKPEDRTIYTYTGNVRPNEKETLKQLKDLKDEDSKLFGDADGDGNITIDSASGESISFSDLKKYIYGKDIDGYRKRVADRYGNTWKLGDVVYSTPKIVNYKDYSVAFVGANDGMLHAFLAGKYRYDRLGAYQSVKLANSSTDEQTDKLGAELWAFIPKNALPYLRFLADASYCHMYYIDLTPYIVEIKDKWGNTVKEILIGGMRLGGATACKGTDCINPPKDTCPNTDRCLGLSSYFALDITNPKEPKFLWEFTDEDLGFSYSGPALVKKKDGDKWHYYVMFFSGPTDYLGNTEQHLYVFVLSLNSDIESNSFFTISSVYKKDLSVALGFSNAFGGRLFTQGVDYNSDGITDLVFEGVSEFNNKKWQGNVIGVRTEGVNPNSWSYFKLFSNPIGPVVAPISYEKCFDKNFIYFGTGRYFYKQDTPNGTKERLYGLKIDECLNENCSFDPAGLYTSSDSCSNIDDSNYGWYQELLGANTKYNKERTYTKATTTDDNVVFFTTTQPTSDICGFGGRTRLWGMNCATGESLTNQRCNNYQTDKIIGSILLQTSIGKITKFNIKITDVTGGVHNNATPFTKAKGKATKWVKGLSSPDMPPFHQFKPKQPAEILYEIER